MAGSVRRISRRGVEDHIRHMRKTRAFLVGSTEGESGGVPRGGEPLLGRPVADPGGSAAVEVGNGDPVLSEVMNPVGSFSSAHLGEVHRQREVAGGIRQCTVNR